MGGDGGELSIYVCLQEMGQDGVGENLLPGRKELLVACARDCRLSSAPNEGRKKQLPSQSFPDSGLVNYHGIS